VVAEPETTLLTDPGHYRADCQLIVKSTKKRWPISPRVRRMLTSRLDAILSDPESEHRVLIQAARALLEAEKQNQNDEMAAGGIAPGRTVNNTQITINGSDVRAGVRELLNEPDYVEYLRQRTTSADCDAGLICQIREPVNGKALENGSSHGGPGPGTNGHRNGSK
jgi:hypothetical protein